MEMERGRRQRHIRRVRAVTGWNKVDFFFLKFLIVANDRHPAWISKSKKGNLLVPISEFRDKWLQEWLDPGV